MAPLSQGGQGLKAPGRKTYAKVGKANRRRRHRQAIAAQQHAHCSANMIRSFVAKKYPTPPALTVNVDAQTLSVSSGGWVGKRVAPTSQLRSLDELRRLEFEVVAWDGM